MLTRFPSSERRSQSMFNIKPHPISQSSLLLTQQAFLSQRAKGWRHVRKKKKKPRRFEAFAALSSFLTVQSVEEGKNKREREKKRNWKKIPIPSRRLSAIPAGLPTLPQAWDQWWCSNLTDWAQGFVCLKPLTYFYSHCRSRSLYGVIAELMQHIYSNTGRKKLASGEAFGLWFGFLLI